MALRRRSNFKGKFGDEFGDDEFGSAGAMLLPETPLPSPRSYIETKVVKTVVVSREAVEGIVEIEAPAVPAVDKDKGGVGKWVHIRTIVHDHWIHSVWQYRMVK